MREIPSPARGISIQRLFELAYLLALVVLAALGLPDGVPYAGPTDPVRIVSAVVSSQTPHAGDTVSATVVTTSNASAVTAQVGTVRMPLTKVAPGTFQEDVTIPAWAPSGSYTVTIVATRADGVATSSTLPVDVR